VEFSSLAEIRYGREENRKEISEKNRRNSLNLLWNGEFMGTSFMDTRNQKQGFLSVSKVESSENLILSTRRSFKQDV
jgi:hypothetical protein